MHVSRAQGGVALYLLALGVLAPVSACADSGLVTFYTRQSCQQEGNSGTYTASGARFQESAFTVALPHRRFGGRYRVSNLATQQSVIVTHTDFGPGRGPRSRGVIADLTPTAYDALGCKRGITRHGVAWGECQVTVEPL